MTSEGLVGRNPLPLLPLRHGVVLPGELTRLPVGRAKSRALAERLAPGSLVLLGVQRDGALADPGIADLLDVAVLARLEDKADHGARGHVLSVRGLSRVKLESQVQSSPYLVARVSELVPTHTDEAESAERARSLRSLVHEIVANGADVHQRLDEAQTPSDVADVVLAFIGPDDDVKRSFLVTLDATDRLRRAGELFSAARSQLELRGKVDAEVRRELTDQQRQNMLRQQLRAIQKELGEEEDPADALRDRLTALELPDDVRKAVDRELTRLAGMNAQQAEAHVIRSHLEWIADLPWSERADVASDLEALARRLDADHHGLAEVKKRILEHFAVQKLTGKPRGTILALVGPPGVGKTSLAQSIADATGRPLVRVALGGVRDEAEIRGHRRTYVGAIPGRILHGLRKAKVKNPVMVLDEIDKMSRYRDGNPESALLEVLDPEQNATFVDHYLEQPFDLSEVVFVATANDLAGLSAPLLDRLEILEVQGYPEEEKVQIAKKHLLPKVLSRHGLTPESLTIDDEALTAIVRERTREAGVRKLEQRLAAVARAVALEIARSTDGPKAVHVTAADLDKYLGRKRMKATEREIHREPGIAAGLAWTPVGGDVLFIETTRMPGKGRVEITGQLGDVMKESARTGLAWLRSHSSELGVDPDWLETHDVHVHVPQGAVPKDGPSAGVTMVTALASLVTGRAVRSDTAMTGEATLRGRVLPVGGIESKVLAAQRAGYTRIILPKDNEIDLEDVPASVREKVEFILASELGDVLAAALEPVALTPTISLAKPSVAAA